VNLSQPLVFSMKMETANFIPSKTLRALKTCPISSRHCFSSPFCGLGTLLVNNSEYFSVPFTRLVNFEKLYQDILPLVPKLTEPDVGIRMMAKLKSILDNSTAPGVKLPNILSFLTDQSKLTQALEFIDNTQLIVVHNHMDVSNIDMVRRCSCAVLSKNQGPGFVACCNNCL